jgi:hypothetical protein
MSVNGVWSLFSRDFGHKETNCVKIVMSKCIDPWQPIVLID